MLQAIATWFWSSRSPEQKHKELLPYKYRKTLVNSALAQHPCHKPTGSLLSMTEEKEQPQYKTPNLLQKVLRDCPNSDSIVTNTVK